MAFVCPLGAPASAPTFLESGRLFRLNTVRRDEDLEAHAHETLLWASKAKGARYTFNYDLINGPDPASELSSVWRIPAVPTREKTHGRHPTQKPLRLLRRVILACTGEGELVFDPFSGSGTSGVASKELGRFFVGAEKERGYAELAGRRIGGAQRGAMLEATRAIGGGDRKVAGGASAWCNARF